MVDPGTRIFLLLPAHYAQAGERAPGAGGQLGRPLTIPSLPSLSPEGEGLRWRRAFPRANGERDRVSG
jgi:hypothetical protein